MPSPRLGFFVSKTNSNEVTVGREFADRRQNVTKRHVFQEKRLSRHYCKKRLAEKMSLSAKTLSRIIKGTHSPSYQTILKMYRYLKGTLNDRETVMKMPPVLAECVKLENENFSLTNQDTDFSVDISFYLKSDSVFRSIYIETATGSLSKEKVGYEHGASGLKTLEYMVDLGVIEEFEPHNSFPMSFTVF